MRRPQTLVRRNSNTRPRRNSLNGRCPPCFQEPKANGKREDCRPYSRPDHRQGQQKGLPYTELEDRRTWSYTTSMKEHDGPRQGQNETEYRPHPGPQKQDRGATPRAIKTDRIGHIVRPLNNGLPCMGHSTRPTTLRVITNQTDGLHLEP